MMGGGFLDERFEKAIQLGLEIVENGGEISRAEDTVERLCIAQGAERVNVFIIPSLISVTAKINGEEVTTTRRIYKTNLNLGRLEEINNTSRVLCGDKNAKGKISYNYPLLIQFLGVMLATGSFAVYFGGSFLDALFSGIAGLAITYIPYGRSSFNIFSRTLIESTIAGVLSFIPSIIGINAHPDKIMIGTIMILIPGMSIGTAIKDMMTGNLIAGILQLTQAIVVAFAIALGFAVALIIFGSGYIA